jgi:uncharacterized membrane protein
MIAYYVGSAIAGILIALAAMSFGFPTHVVFLAFLLGMLGYSVDEVYRELKKRNSAE